MSQLVVYGPGGKPAYIVETSAVETAEAAEADSALRGAGPVDAVERLEAAGQAVADACEHLLGKVRQGLSGGAVPTELELTFGVTLAGEGGIPVIGKASAEASFEVRALWSSGDGA